MNLLVSLDIDVTLGWDMAGSGLSFVWVFSLVVISGRFEVGEGISLPSTVATVRSSVAGDNLLLGEGFQLSGLDLVVTLDGGNS